MGESRLPPPKTLTWRSSSNTMALLKGTVTFVKYRVEGEEPSSFREFVHQRLKKFAFQELEGVVEEKTTGWVGLGSIVDTDFEQAPYAVGEFLAFSLRIDRRAVPPALLKKQILEAEARIRLASERKFLSREERAEIKDRVREILLSKMMPVPTLIDVCWSVSGRWLLFCSVSESVRKDFEKLFKRSFDMDVVPFVPWDPALLPEKIHGPLERLVPESLV